MSSPVTWHYRESLINSDEADKRLLSHRDNAHLQLIISNSSRCYQSKRGGAKKKCNNWKCLIIIPFASGMIFNPRKKNHKQKFRLGRRVLLTGLTDSELMLSSRPRWRIRSAAAIRSPEGPKKRGPKEMGSVTQLLGKDLFIRDTLSDGGSISNTPRCIILLINI